MTDEHRAEIIAALQAAVSPGARFKLVARGLSRGMIWRNGTLPEGAPAFAEALSTDLLDHGYSVLAQALELRDGGDEPTLVESGFRVAAEAIESTVRKGDPADPSRGFHLVVAAAAFHLSHYAARAFCLIPADVSAMNLSSADRALALLMRRSLRSLRMHCLSWLADPNHSDDTVAARLEALNDEFGFEDTIAMALTRNFYRALAVFDYALQTGDEEAYERARAMLLQGTEGAAETHHVTLWWANTLARHLIDDLWGLSLHTRLPILPGDGDAAIWNDLRSRFISALVARDVSQVDLWPSQVEAARRAVDPTDDLVVAMPTSAGKTRVAELCILRALSSGKRVIYVTPLRALSAQVERTLGRTFRPLGYSVSSLYGASGVAAADIGSLKASSIVVATPEKLDFAIRQQASVLDDVALVVLDEGHMIGLGTREIRYEVLVQRLLRRPDAADRRLVCLSAIFDTGEPFDDFTAWLRADEPGTAVRSDWRPTRLRPAVLVWGKTTGRLEVVVDDEEPFVPRFLRAEAPAGKRKNPFPQNPKELTIAVAKTLVNDDHRVLIYCPQRKSVEGLAKECLKLHRQGHFSTVLRHEDAIRAAKRVGTEWLGADHVAVQALDLGVAVHHAALPRPFLSEVERLLNDKVLPVAIASPTLAQGIDLSCSALIFYSIYRAGNPIPASEFANVIGRAGRAYVDLDGLIIFPVNDDYQGRQRKRQYKQLQIDASSRTMESGLLMLIFEIAQRLAAQLGAATWEEVIDYVTNHEGAWASAAAKTGAEEPGDEGDGRVREVPLPELLADLDTAIFGTVEKLECQTEELADALDEALRSSLWRRRLARMDPNGQGLQSAIFTGRAKWLWKNTNTSKRMGFFAAGIGFETGSYLDDHLSGLLRSLVEAEVAVLNADVNAAAKAVTAMAEVLFEVHPFVPDELPARWKELIVFWLSGAPLGSVLSKAASEEVEFIQQAVVYQLVWAIEAVRVHGVASGNGEAVNLLGIAALALTYGVASLPAALFVEAGLPSRQMAARLCEAYSPAFDDHDGFKLWLESMGDEITADGFWTTETERATWGEFLGRWRTKNRSDWVESEHYLEANWDPFYDPVAGHRLRVIDDNDNEVTDLCEEDMSLIGSVKGRYFAANSGHVTAVIDHDTRRVKLSRWGPRE